VTPEGPHPGHRVLVVAFAAVIGVAGVVAGAPSASGTPATPTVQVTPATDVALGQRILVDLDHWPIGIVTVSVCGNGARRGTQDCDLPSSESTSTLPDKKVSVALTVMRPPVDCPCVVRVSTSASRLVQLAPIGISGVPLGPALPDASGGIDPNSLDVSARVESGHASWPRSWAPPFAGPTDRTLVLVLKNHGVEPISGLRVAGAVGRDATSGAPISAEVPGTLAPGASQTVTIPFVLETPAWGSYIVTGTIFGLAAPVRFTVHTHNTPWGLELMVPLLLVVAAQLVRRREARRRAAEAAKAELARAEADGISALPQSSPLVGEADGGHWGAPSYDDGAVQMPQPRDPESQISLP